MDAPEALNRCNDVQLKRLFSLGLATDPQASLLSLARQFQTPEPGLDPLAVRLGGTSLQQLVKEICDNGTTVSVLEAVKESAKQQRQDAETPMHRNAFTIFYHATIAAAFANHGAMISSRDIRSRFGLYQDLALVFAGHPFQQIFQTAVNRMPFPEDLQL